MVNPHFDALFESLSNEPAKFNYAFSKRLVAGKKILDLGCWVGYFEFAARSEKQIIGLDTSLHALKFAKKNLSNSFVNASVFSLPFKPNSFDAACLWEVLEHLPKGSEANALQELHGVLKTGGFLFISTPNNNLFSNILDPAFLFGHRHYSKQVLKKLLHKTGFELALAKEAGGFFKIADTFLMYLWKHLFHRKKPVIKIIDKMVEKEMNSKGFEHLYAIAKKK